MLLGVTTLMMHPAGDRMMFVTLGQYYLVRIPLAMETQLVGPLGNVRKELFMTAIHHIGACVVVGGLVYGIAWALARRRVATDKD
jgi:hypothetical protein